MELKDKIKEIIKTNNSYPVIRDKLEELDITYDEWYHLKLKFKYAYIINTLCWMCRYGGCSYCGKRIQELELMHEHERSYIYCDEFEWD